MGKGQRRKGHDYERETASTFRNFGLDAKRGLGQTRGGSEVADVMVKLPLSEPLATVEGFWVECKRGARTNIKSALQQATEALEDNISSGPEYAGYIPLAVTKDDRHMSMVTLNLYDFLALLRAVSPPIAQSFGLANSAIEEDEWRESSK